MLQLLQFYRFFYIDLLVYSGHLYNYSLSISSFTVNIHSIVYPFINVVLSKALFDRVLDIKEVL